ncbi:CopG family transcriptional regulator [Castellaniella denitrificans]|uniref:CopG family transcriptional regulator n=1 Tax=Castellaniella denitrificans TaxID=56119 RepID=UPI00360E74C9
MAQILIDVTEAQLQALAEAARVQNKPLAVIVRDAIAAYVFESSPSDGGSEVFGLWAESAMSGREYQAAHRAEW